MVQKFYMCKHCGNIIAYVKHSGVPVMCCGERMQALEPGVVDASPEKHTPVVSLECGRARVTVGSVAHPMLGDDTPHYIKWIALETRQGNQRKTLAPGDAPSVCFALCEGDEVLAAYAYCNLHGLWKS